MNAWPQRRSNTPPEEPLNGFRALVTITLASAVLAAAGCTRSGDAALTAQAPLIERYCTDCHNPLDREAGLVLDPEGLADVAMHPEIWEGVIHKLRIGLMPPAGAPRPERGEALALVASLEQALDRAAAGNPRPGPMPLHRLSRAEYANAIEDLVGIPIDAENLLPADGSSHGFDHLVDAQKTSPLLLERYLAIAQRVAAMALGNVELEPRTTSWSPPADLSHNRWLPGMPLGTRGGLSTSHFFPVDGTYELRPELWEAAASTVRGLEGFETPFELEILIDGVPVHRAPIGGIEDDALSNRDQGSATAAVSERVAARVPVAAGLHTVAVTFVMKSFAADQRLLQPFGSDVPPGNDAYGWPRVRRFLISGPYDATGPGASAARRRVLTCTPGEGLSHLACAESILERLARQAFSRPLAEAELAVLLEFYRQGSHDGRDFERGVELALARILSGPEFLFRGEPERSDVPPGAVYPIGDVALASRLARFLWSRLPDDALLDAAIEGHLSDPEQRGEQVRRMLAHPHAEALVTRFAAQWLKLAALRTKSPDRLEYPFWDANLRDAMRTETTLFLRSVLLDNRSVLDLLDADYTFMNERLAKHYGIDGVFGDAFRRVELMAPERRGLLGQGSILFLTSEANRTSPVLRGKWVMDTLFNAPPAPPPPNIPSLDESAVPGVALTVRERLERHSEDPVCAGCHATMDPAGFALERFDPLGRRRHEDEGQPIDTSAVLPDGTDIGSPQALREALLARPDIFVGAFVEKLMTYALGRGLDARDMPAVREVMRTAAADDYRFHTIVRAIVESPPFRLRERALPAPPGESAE